MTATKTSSGEGVTPPPPDHAERPGPGTPFVHQIYNFLSSIRFTIFILSFIAVACVFGTLVIQQGSPEEYRTQYSEAVYAILKFLGVTDVFHSPWFFLLMGLFALNLVFCTLGRFARLLKHSRETRLPGEKALATMPHSFFVRGRIAREVLGLFRGYRIRAGGDGAYVLEKGSLSKYGVYMVHGSIILILVGSLIGLICGYRGSLTLDQGESKDTITIRGSTAQTRPLGFTIKCDEFKVSFYPGGEPKDYVSRLQIIDKGRAAVTRDVRVNHPLSYKGSSIYQASYGSRPSFFFTVGDKKVRLSEGNTFNVDGLTLMPVNFKKSVHDFGPGVQVAYVENDRHETDQPRTVWFFRDVPKMRTTEIGGVRIVLDEIAEDYYTGLEVSYDPGVWFVWAGFALLLAGLYVNFFMYHRRVYVVETKDGVLAAATLPRNREAFREEFEKWRKKADDLRA